MPNAEVMELPVVQQEPRVEIDSSHEHDGRKPVHIVVVIGEETHVNHLVPLLQREIGPNTACMSVNDIADVGPKSVSRITMLDYMTRNHGHRDMEAVVLCRDFPMTTTYLEVATRLFEGRISFLVVETDSDDLERELLLDKAARRKFHVSLQDHIERMKRIGGYLSQIPKNMLIRLEHRKSVKAQIRFAHFKIAATTNRKLPTHL